MAAMKKEGDGSHPSSHYLVVEDATKPTTWHLRVRDASGKLDHTLMGAAWAALHGGYRGNKYQGPNKEAAMRKLMNLYKKEGMPMPGDSKSIIYKDKKGQQWFVGVYSNNFEDREAETFTWNSHVDYAKWVNETGVKLPVTVLHQPKYPVEVHLAQFMGLANGTFSAKEFSDNYMKLYQPFAFAQTEAIIPVNGFMLVIAKILKNKAHVAELIQESGWGMSHGYLAFDRNEDTLHQYRSFEFTSLPLSMAANFGTLSSITENTMDEMKGLSEQDQAKIKELLNADPNDVEQAFGEAQKILQRVLNSKEMGEPKEEDEEDEQQDDYTEIREKIFADLGVEQLNKAFTTITSTLQAIQQRLDDYDMRLKANERSEDERIAEQLTPKVFDWTDWKGLDVEPDLDSLKEGALGNKPVASVKAQPDTDNPLYLGWIAPMGLGQQ